MLYISYGSLNPLPQPPFLTPAFFHALNPLQNLEQSTGYGMAHLGLNPSKPNYSFIPCKGITEHRVFRLECNVTFTSLIILLANFTYFLGEHDHTSNAKVIPSSEFRYHSWQGLGNPVQWTRYNPDELCASKCLPYLLYFLSGTNFALY